MNAVTRHDHRNSIDDRGRGYRQAMRLKREFGARIADFVDAAGAALPYNSDEPVVIAMNDATDHLKNMNDSKNFVVRNFLTHHPEAVRDIVNNALTSDEPNADVVKFVKSIDFDGESISVQLSNAHF